MNQGSLTEPAQREGVDINAKDNNGLVPISLVAVAGHDAVLRLLAARSDDINAKDNFGLK